MREASQKRDAGAAPAIAQPEIGELVADRFEIEGFASAGGMGAVYRARDLATGQPAAVKVMGAPRTHGDERFAREARVLAELSHPAIVRYLAHGHTRAGAAFLAMEWLDGEDLACALARAPLSPAAALTLARRVCEGVAAAHDRGVVHRDLKPSNIFLVGGEPGAARVLDFGVARSAVGRDTRHHTLTRAGTVLGTVGYMAPEQAMGSMDIDARADVFSIGCVLFECLTGQAAFHGLHDVAVLAKVLREEPPRVGALRPELGEAFDAVLARTLAKDRAARPADARALLRELEVIAPPVVAARARLVPVGQTLTTSERKVVSIILARTDAAAATMVAGPRDDEDATLAELAERFDAEPLPLYGGALLLSLSGYGAATDQACRAASCALALRRLRPELTVAVATGSIETEGALPVGDAIDRAASLLTELLPPQAVAIDALTFGLLDGRFDVRKTKSALHLLGELGDVEAPRLLMGRPTPCVGREKELALLDATFDECVADDVARTLLITAPPGIGKSRLGRAFIERARAKGVARLVVGRADQRVAGSARSLARRLVRSTLGLRAGEGPDEQRARLRGALASALSGESLEATSALLSELIDLPDEAAPHPLLRAARSDPEVMREQTRRAFEAFLAATLARSPVVLLLEDLHWGDAASVGYIESALRALAARPLLVVALGRPELCDRFPGLRQVGDAQDIRLGPLTRRAAERLVRSVLGEHAASAATVERIVERADGNAFYLEELIRRVAEGGGELPATVLAMAQSRLERLPLAARRVLRAASVFGGASCRGGVAALLGARNEAAEWLELLTDQEILVRRRNARFPNEQEYEFRHSLLRDAAYAMLTADDRTIAHRLAGHWLEQMGERDARVLADHFEQGGVAERALHFLVAAAVSALEAGDYDGATALALRGIALGASGEERGTFLMVEGYVGALHTRVDVERLAESITLLPKASPHWWLALSTLLFGSMALGRRAQALSYLELALTTPPGDSLTGAYGAALQAMAAGTVIVGRTELAWSVLERIEGVARDDPRSDPLFHAWCDLARCQLATVSPYRGRFQLEQALLWGRSAVFAMRTLGSLPGQAAACFYLGYISRVLGLYDEAERNLSEGIAHATASGNVLIAQYAKLILTLVQLSRGALDEAERSLGELAQSTDASVVHGAHAMTAEVQLRRGAHEAARALAEAASVGPSAPYRRVAYSTLARAELALGAHAAVLDAVARSRADEAVATPEYEADLLASMVEALAALGRHDEARATLERAAQLVADVSAGIADPALRAGFLQQIDGNARVVALASQQLI